MQIREMTIQDCEKVYALWMSCKNMGFNDVDDSKLILLYHEYIFRCSSKLLLSKLKVLAFFIFS